MQLARENFPARLALGLQLQAQDLDLFLVLAVPVAKTAYAFTLRTVAVVSTKHHVQHKS